MFLTKFLQSLLISLMHPSLKKEVLLFCCVLAESKPLNGKKKEKHL